MAAQFYFIKDKPKVNVKLSNPEKWKLIMMGTNRTADPHCDNEEPYIPYKKEDIDKYDNPNEKALVGCDHADFIKKNLIKGMTFEINNAGEKGGDTVTIYMNKNLESQLQAIFKEIKELGPSRFKINKYYNDKAYNLSDFRRGSKVRSHLSQHAYGAAIDINFHENPYIKDYTQASKDKYKSEEDSDILIRTENHPVVRIFKKYGWGWGGIYGNGNDADYMHFSLTGN